MGRGCAAETRRTRSWKRAYGRTDGLGSLRTNSPPACAERRGEEREVAAAVGGWGRGACAASRRPNDFIRGRAVPPLSVYVGNSLKSLHSHLLGGDYQISTHSLAYSLPSPCTPYAAFNGHLFDCEILYEWTTADPVIGYVGGGLKILFKNFS